MNLSNSYENWSILQIACEMTEMQGGPTQSALDVSKYLSQGNNLVVIGNVDSKTKSILKSNNISTINLRSDLKNNSGICLRDLTKLLKIIRKYKIVVSHGFYTFPTLLVNLISQNAHIYVMPHGSLEEYQWNNSRFKKYIFDTIFKFGLKFNSVTFTVATREEMVSINKRFPGSKVEVVGIAVDMPDLSVCNLRREIMNVNLLSFSRIAPKKRIDVSIKALSLLSVNPKARLWIYGTGNPQLIAELNKLVIDLNLSKSVKFEGMIDHNQLSSVFSTADILLLPSENENFAIAVAEAIAHCVPVIVSRAVALSSFVEENSCGEVIEYPDPYLLKDAILKVLSNLEAYRTACEVSRHRLSHAKVKENWFRVIGLIESV